MPSKEQKSLSSYLAELEKKYRSLTEQIRREVDENTSVENSSYDYLLEQRTLIEKQIFRTKFQLKSLITEEQTTRDRVNIGSRVQLQNHKNLSDKREVSLVENMFSVNPQKGYVSPTSPIGRAILGKKVGEKVTVVTPGGTLNYKIVSLM